MVGHIYICIRVDIGIDAPLPVGFFQKKKDREESYIQFKLECLLDFCYKCGGLDHVTMRCKFHTVATVTLSNGIVAKLYGPWLWAEHGRSLLFINPTSEGK